MGVLEGKVMVVTGSSRGLGLAIARACAAEGALLVLSSRSGTPVDEAARALRSAGREATSRACDVSDREQVEALAQCALDTYGRLDVWINNAGTPTPYGPTVHVPPEAFVQTVQTNILGTYYGSIVAMRHFLNRGTGKLINILGRGDRGEPVPLQNGYAASKAWVRSFTLALAREYRESGVGVFAYNPGMMSTDFLTRIEAIEGYERRLRVMPTIIRMWAHSPEIPARRIVWLASPATDGKTGLEIHELGRRKVVLGALREGLRRLAGRGPDQQVQVQTVAPAISTGQDGSRT